MKTEMVERDCPFICRLCGFYWEGAAKKLDRPYTVWQLPNGNIYCSEICATKDENILKTDCHE